MDKKQKKPLLRRILAWIGGTVLTIVLVAVFYVAVVLGQPQSDLDAEVDMHQPLVNASPAVNLVAGQSVDGVAAAFPTPILSCAPGGALTLVGGTSCDMAYENGFARICTLNYADAQGTVLQAVSIYPARALELIPQDGYRLVGAGPAIAGVPSVRMEKAGSIRLHAQAPTGLYVVTVPAMEDEALTVLLRPLQLLAGAE